jgi:hypothetical protein
MRDSFLFGRISEKEMQDVTDIRGFFLRVDKDQDVRLMWINLSWVGIFNSS